MESYSYVNVPLFEFNPNLLELMKARPYTAKDGTPFSRAYVKYNGKNFVIDYPKMITSGPFFNKPKNPNDYPKPNMSKIWKEKNRENPDEAKLYDMSQFELEKIMRALDGIYLALFKKVALLEQGFMLTLAENCTSPEMLDQTNPMTKQTFRNDMRKFMANFYDYQKMENPANPGGKKIPDYSKPFETYFKVRKSPKTNTENAGSDPWDCQFVVAGDPTKTPILWKNLRGNLLHTFRQHVDHIYMAGGSQSIQSKVISSTIYDVIKSNANAMPTEHIAGKQDEMLTQQLSTEQLGFLLKLKEQMLAQNNAMPQTPQQNNQPQMPPPNTATNTANTVPNTQYTQNTTMPQNTHQTFTPTTNVAPEPTHPMATPPVQNASPPQTQTQNTNQTATPNTTPTGGTTEPGVDWNTMAGTMGMNPEALAKMMANMPNMNLGAMPQ